MSQSSLSHSPTSTSSNQLRPKLIPDAGADPAAGAVADSKRRVWLVALGLAVVLVVFAVRALDVARTDSITTDETVHLNHALHFWLTGDDQDMWELGAPRLPHLWNALPTFLVLRQAGLLPDPTDPNRLETINHLVLSDAPRVLFPARCMAIVSGMALVVLVFWFLARARGWVSGLVAAVLVAMVPEVLAHSAIAGSDISFTAAALLALVMLTRYAERPSPGRWMALALSIGLAWAIRHTALMLLILAGGVHLACALKQPRERGPWPLVERLIGSALAGVVLATVAFAVLWACDGFQTITMAELAERATAVQVPSRLGPLDLSAIPVPTSVLSIIKQVRHQNSGHEAYFCGQFSREGWPQYFPVAFLLKTPLGLLVLMIAAAARFRPRAVWEWVSLAALALLWVLLIRNKVNIGVRYALLTYPLAMLWVARHFEPTALRDRAWAAVSLLALVAFAGASISCHPRYLSSFNEIGGGPQQGWLYLADSNIDWGQDFDATATTLRRMGISEVTTDISSDRRMEEPGLFAIANPYKAVQVPAVRPPNRRLYDSEGGYLPVYTRFVAVSVSRLLGLYSQNDMSWLRSRRLVARVNDSVFIFDMDQPAQASLAP